MNEAAERVVNRRIKELKGELDEQRKFADNTERTLWQIRDNIAQIEGEITDLGEALL